ncbi:MAG TPA: Gfo/Idh/MocA family oxidoreductase [Candidatus Marinimicrobia bacterium]|nr:Gfo/Idh/MocA family oxidoreductase [Candidatus Neomarinimicrobiota bacterium]HRS51226.1 Gfo/Idh/MocA family oxidoreductase [Candidatus Neomarinimicrobiota bacterium]HRU91536.1 Gfo/Idh/MocA family oxidoreductase [Candidatus Neomarinimicrobiota bacterium]
MNTVKVGIIGAGFMGTAHLENLRRIPGVEVKAIADIKPESAKILADKFDISQVYDDWRELVNNSEIDVIHNCTPNYLHFEINKAAILAGKAVISEKPLTNSVAESEELVRLAREKKVLNAVNFNYRNYPLIRHARQLIVSGKLGEIFLAHGHYLQDWLMYPEDYNWRIETETGGDSRAIADIGSHWCDLVQFITGQKIVEVFADLVTVHKLRKKPQSEVATFKGKEIISDSAQKVTVKTEDAGAVLFHLEKGGHGVFTVSQVSAGYKNGFDIAVDGSQMSLAWKQEEPNQIWLGYRDQANQVLVKDPALIEADSRSFAHYPGGHPEGYPDTFKNLFLNFYAAVRAGKSAPQGEAFPTFEAGLQENRIVEAVLKSHQEKRWIKV